MGQEKAQSGHPNTSPLLLETMNKKHKRYIWNYFYPLCVKSDMGCAIVEGLLSTF